MAMVEVEVLSLAIDEKNQYPVVILQSQLKPIGRAGWRLWVVHELWSGSGYFVCAPGCGDGQSQEQQREEPARCRPGSQ